MNGGKQTCRLLKVIRKQVAEANDIEYVISECRYKGDCLGTCPKCEAEVRYLEQALERKRLAGKVVSLLGLSVGLMAFPQAAYNMDDGAAVRQETIYSNAVIVKGRVTDSTGCPMAGANILERGTTNGTCSDSDGYFTLPVSGERPLVVSFVGYKSREVTIPEGDVSNLHVVLHVEIIAMDEIRVESGYTVTKQSFVAGMLTTVRKAGIPPAEGGKFTIKGCITDENGTPLPGVVISRKRKGKDFPEVTTSDEGQFWLHMKRRRRFWLFKDGYQARKVKLTKKDTSGIKSFVLKREK